MYFCTNCIKNIQTELWRFRGIFTRLNLRNTNKFDIIIITVILGLINIARARLLTRGDMTAKDFSMANVLSWAVSETLLRKSREFVAPAWSPLLWSWLPGCCCFKDSFKLLKFSKNRIYFLLQLVILSFHWFGQNFRSSESTSVLYARMRTFFKSPSILY